MPSTSATANHYLDELTRLKCAPDMLKTRLFPNAKEVTESFGAYNAARTHLQDVAPLGSPNVTCICVGDGFTPRTAATFAFRTAWQCVSIDPKLRPRGYSIDRLRVIPKRVEDVLLVTSNPVVIVAVHSHVSLPESLACVPAAPIVGVIAIPCCVPLELERPPDIEYADPNIWSPKRTVRIWRALGGEK